LATPNAVSTPKKPTILCLHGGGTNRTIFNIQTIRIQRALATTFDFLFIDAPFEAPAGPGVKPIFEGCGPFYRWTKPGVPDELPEETKKLLSETLADPNRNFIGIMGFSQGAKCAAGLVLEQQHVAKNNTSTSTKGTKPFQFKFGVFLNAVYPPLVNSMSDEEKGELINLPSLHVIGTVDPFNEESHALYGEHFSKKTARKVEFELGHKLPTSEKETARIVGEINRLYRETSGRPVGKAR
jgi:predicted esterase